MTLAYDALGRLEHVASSLGTTSYSYAGDVLQAIDWQLGPRRGRIQLSRRGDRVTYAADVDGVHSETSYVEREGKLVELRDDYGTSFLTYNDERLVRVSSERPGDAIMFAYDARGRLERHNDGHQTLVFSWDDDDKLTSIRGWDAPITIRYACP